MREGDDEYEDEDAVNGSEVVSSGIGENGSFLFSINTS